MGSFKDITNKKFHHLTALRLYKTYKRNNGQLRYVWTFQCDCGKIVNLIRYGVTGGMQKSCGCMSSELKSKNRFKGCGQLSGQYFSKIRYCAKKRKIAFQITVEQCWCIYLEQGGKCALTGIDIICDPKHAVAHENKNVIQTASLDRIDSTKGYTIDNIQWVHKAINEMKMALKQKEFIAWCKMVADYAK